MTPQGLWVFLSLERPVVEEFPSNSQRRRAPREEAPKTDKRVVHKVVEGQVVQRKTPRGKRIKELFLGGADRSIWEFVFQDVIVPNIRDMLYEANQQAMERVLYPGSEPRAYRRTRPGDPRRSSVTNYNGISRGPAREDDRRQMSRRARANHDFGEIIIPTRPEAEAVLEGLFELLNEYDVATVADLYEMVGVSSQFTDRNWGWTDLRGTDIRRVREGYLLDLPRPEDIR